MIRKISFVDSIALYGSIARGDSDQLSDQDVILVSKNESDLVIAKKLAEEIGYSCSCYTWRKLKKLSQKKALFIQHLKKEAVIVSDRDEQLQSFLKDFEPASDYSREIECTKELIATTQYYANTFYIIGWALDVLAVAIRNIGILQLANEECYVFSYDAVLDKLVSIGLMSGHDKHFIASLRLYKSAYRNRRFDLLPKVDILKNLHNIISRVFRIDMTSKCVTAEQFFNYCMYSPSAVKTDSWYQRLRLCEGAYMSIMSQPIGTTTISTKNLDEIQQAITRPSAYNLLLSDSARNLQSAIERAYPILYKLAV